MTNISARSRASLIYSALAVGSLFASSIGLSVPKYETTVLPVTNAMLKDESLSDVIEFIPKLQVHQDSINPNQYYYVPPVRAVGGGIAGTLLTKDSAIKLYDDLEKSRILSTGEDAYKYLRTLQSQYLAVMDRLKSTDPRDTQLVQGLTQIATHIKDIYDQEFEKLDSRTELLPQSIQNSILEYEARTLALAGFAIESDQPTFREIQTTTARFSNSNGGMLTVNVFGGFYGHETAIMRKYHEARAKLGLPPIKISLIPVEKLSWKGLAEGENSNFFSQVAGGGTLVGATINADLTILSAREFKKNLPPVILPVYAKANLIQKYPVFKAHLKCDFTTGWELYGRADIKDGLIIYNNDISQSFVATDVARVDEPCTLTMTGGGGNEAREAAYRKALETVQERILDIYFTRFNIAKDEKDAYLNSVIADIQSNRHRGANKGWFSVATSYLTTGWTGVFVQGFSKSSNFYWHTNRQNMKVLSNLKWEQTIVDDSNSKIETDIPMQICVAYNPQRKAYVACDLWESENATSIADAIEKISQSPECSGDVDTETCGRNREESAPVNPATGNLLPNEL